VELQRAHRLLSGASDVIRYDTSSTAVAYVQYDAGGAGTARYVSLAGASATLATGFTFQALFVENGARVLVSKGANSSLTEGTPEVVDPITGARFPLGIHVALGTFFRLTPERVMFDWSSTSQNAGGMGLARLDVGDVVTVARRSNVWRRPRDSNAWLAMLNGTTGLQLIDVASGAAHTVLTSDFPYAFDLTPDGQRLVYSVIATYVVPTAGGTPVKLADTREYVLSPDGSMILVQPSISSPLQIIPVAGGPARTITVDVLTQSLGLNTFSSDGAFVFFQTINAFKVASTAALDVQIVTTQTNAFVATYVPARHMAYFVADNATNFSTRDLYRMPLDRSGPRVALATGIVSGLLKSPSGRYILYPVPGLPDGGSMLTLTDTTSEAVVPLAPGLFSRAVFSPDERWILFVDSEGWVRLGRTADGTTFRVALGGSPLSFSPSGTRAMFVANGVLATLPVEPCPVPTFVARDLDPNSPPRWVGDQAVAFFRANVPAPLGVASGFYLASIP
jgi:hypothetical protein